VMESSNGGGQPRSAARRRRARRTAAGPLRPWGRLSRSWSSDHGGGGSRPSTSCGSCAKPRRAAARARSARCCAAKGLYSSLLTEWRRARDAGALDALERQRGAEPRHPLEPRTPSCAVAPSARGGACKARTRDQRMQGNVSALLGEHARAQGRHEAHRAMIEQAVEELTPLVAPGRRAGGASRTRRSTAGAVHPNRGPRTHGPRPRGHSLEPSAKAVSPSCIASRFVDSSPAAVWGHVASTRAAIWPRQRTIVPAAGRQR